MSVAWPTHKLREIADIRVSNVDKKTHASEEPVKLCNYMDVYSNEYVTGGIDFMEASATLAEIGRFGLSAGDVVITKDSETPDDIGIPTVIAEDIPGLVCGYHLAMIRPDAERIDSVYLAKQLSTSQATRYFSLHASGSTRYGLPIGAIESLEIPTPPKPEQTKIAEILSTVDRAIEQTEALIAKQQRLKTGLMQDLLTRGIDENGNLRSEQTHQFKDSPLGRIPVEWEVVQLNQVVDELITYGIVQAGPHVEGGIPYIRTGDMSGEFIDVDKLLRTTSRIANAYKRSEVSEGDIVFALRATVGKVLPVDRSLDGSNLTQGTAKISPKKGIVSGFLIQNLRTTEVQDQIRLCEKGTTFMEITLTDLRQILVAMPKREAEQNAIAKVLDEHDGTAAKYSKIRQKLLALKTALMQDLLTGRKRVTALLDETEAAA